MFNPKVSIIIPVYCGSNYLREAIESALDQSYKNIEILVINDGSSDNGETEKIAKSYGNKIRYFYKTNGGVATALNLGILKMDGEYFSWLSHDDVYYPNKIEKQISYLEKEKKKNVIFYSDFDIIDKNSKKIGHFQHEEFDSKKFRYGIVIGKGIHGCTPLITKKCFNKVGLFNENLKTVQDINMWFRLSTYYKFKHIPEKLIKSRIHPLQISKTSMELHFKEHTKFYIDCLKSLNVKDLLSTAIYQEIINFFKEKIFLRQIRHIFSIILLFTIKNLIPNIILEYIFNKLKIKNDKTNCQKWITVYHSVFSVILFYLLNSFNLISLENIFYKIKAKLANKSKT